MAGVLVIWFSAPVACICAIVTTLQHILTISSQCAHVFCIQQSIAHVVHYKPTDKLNLIVSLNVWRPCKWFTFHCYVVMSCILTTVQQCSTTSGPHWNVSYTLIQTACVLHHRSAVLSRILSSLTEWQACKLSDFQCLFTCIYANVTTLLHFITITC